MRILCIGAYYYGNYGDRSYTYALNDVLGDDHELTFANDVVAPETIDPTQFDALLIGGGGLLTHDRFNKETSCTILALARAFKTHGLPIGLISVGFQSIFALRLPPYDNIDGASALTELLNMCAAVYVRSPSDFQRARVLITNEHVDLIWAADLVYARDMPAPAPAPAPVPGTANILLLPTGTFSVKNTHQMILRRMKQMLLNDATLTPGTLFVCNFGGDENKAAIDRIVQRDRAYIEEPARRLGFDVKLITQDEADVLLQQRNLKLIITGRYHGLVYGRKLGISVTTLGAQNYKFEADLGDVLSNPGQMARDALSRVLYRFKTRVPEDLDKNTLICKCGASFGEVPFLQSLTFIELYDIYLEMSAHLL